MMQRCNHVCPDWEILKNLTTLQIRFLHIMFSFIGEEIEIVTDNI